MNEIIKQIIDERKRQHKLWGEQNHPSIVKDFPHPLSEYYGIRDEEEAKIICESRLIHNEGTWADIFLEEVSEVIHADSPEKMKEELIQVLAVGVAWIQSIDKNEILNKK